MVPIETAESEMDLYTDHSENLLNYSMQWANRIRFTNQDNCTTSSRHSKHRQLTNCLDSIMYQWGTGITELGAKRLISFPHQSGDEGTKNGKGH